MTHFPSPFYYSHRKQVATHPSKSALGRWKPSGKTSTPLAPLIKSLLTGEISERWCPVWLSEQQYLFGIKWISQEKWWKGVWLGASKMTSSDPWLLTSLSKTFTWNVGWAYWLPCNKWDLPDIVILNLSLLFIWNSNLTGHLVFLFANLATMVCSQRWWFL